MSQTPSNPIENGLIQSIGAYQKDINIKLFNDIIAFIAKTTDVETRPIYRNLAENHLWYSRVEDENIQQQYGFRYFGELLERFEDRAGADIRDIHAIALALAYAKEMLSDDMFVGNQKRNFINKIKTMAVDDTYLKGAVYLLCKDESIAETMLGELEQTEYTRTEELVFVLSLYDTFDTALEVFKPQLLNLIGKARSIAVYNNMGIFAWLIKRFDAVLKNCRSKDMALLRAMAALPTSFVKAGTKQYDVMLENGYSPEEIVYMNGLVLLFRPVCDTLSFHSIVTEKIIVELCRTFINSEIKHSDDTYTYLKWLLIAYDSFAIKLQGYNGVLDAIKQDIVLKNPQTFIWLYRFKKELPVYYFDVLDGKWDVLAQDMGLATYRMLFDNQLRHKKNISTKLINEYIKKYEKLTQSPYLATFGAEYDCGRDSVFSLLVEKDVIDLVDAFVNCPGRDTYDGINSEKKPAMIEYIGYKVEGLKSRKSFDFFKYFLENFGFHHMHRLFTDNRYSGRNESRFFADAFYEGASYSYSHKEERIKIKRDFLSDDEHRMLFEWLDDYMYLYKPDDYINFSIHTISEPFIGTLYPKDELRQIYDSVRDMKTSTMEQYSAELKQIFLSETELKAEKDAEEARRADEKKQAIQQHLQGLRNSFEEHFDGTFKSVNKFLDKHKYSFRDEENIWRIVGENLERVLTGSGYRVDTKETGRFIKLSGQLIKEGFLAFEKFKKYLSNIK